MRDTQQLDPNRFEENADDLNFGALELAKSGRIGEAREHMARFRRAYGDSGEPGDLIRKHVGELRTLREEAYDNALARIAHGQPSHPHDLYAIRDYVKEVHRKLADSEMFREIAESKAARLQSELDRSLCRRIHAYVKHVLRMT